LDKDGVELLRHDEAAAEPLISTSLPKLGGAALGDAKVLDNSGVGMRVSRRRKSRTLHIISKASNKISKEQTFDVALDLPSVYPFYTHLQAENESKDQIKMKSIPQKHLHHERTSYVQVAYVAIPVSSCLNPQT
jgi:hypothetical protein